MRPSREALRRDTLSASMLLRFFVGLLALTIGGCASLDYIAQAGAGQDELLTRSRPIDELLREGRLTPRTRRLVGEIDDMKHYGERHGLRATRNYTRYARLDRPAAVWVVSACEPLRFRSKVWSFPVVGTITYLGWFHLDAANRAADDLRTAGWDADVRTASAYSTAGWFDDPLLSTMIVKGHEARGELANTVFHESMHATFFVPGQSRLNESIANFVGDRMAERYMDEMAGPDALETRAYRAAEARIANREALLRAAYEELDALYASVQSDDDKRAEKARIFAALERALGTTRRLSNASLVQYKTYHSGEDELASLLIACGGDVRRFVRTLDHFQHGHFPVDQAEPADLLKPLLTGPCAP